MKNKFTSSIFGLLGVLMLFSLTCCTAGEFLELPTGNGNATSVLTYDWSTTQDNDTTWLICNQKVTYTAEDGQTESVNFKASVKLWPEKQVVNFGMNEDPKPQHESNNFSSSDDGTLPTVRTALKTFLFNDGQTAFAEIHTERFIYPKYHLPYVDITDVVFESATAEQASDANTFMTSLVFSATWKEQSTETPAQGAKPLTAEYTKIRSEQTDELVNTDYTQGHVWNGNDVTLYVEKIETWRIAGQKTQRFSSPALSFTFIGKEDKFKEVKNFDFTGTLSSVDMDIVDISEDGWALQKGNTVKTINFTNGTDNFSDMFEYPRYTASYMLDGKKFDFDLTVTFNETHRITTIDANSVRNITIAEATMLERTLSQTVTSTLSTAGNNPIPDPDPQPEYGKIISFSVTAVFDPSELNKKGDITKKCVSVRYEKGYEWGICAYEENFPASFTFVNSGYTGFNSAAMDTAQSPFQLARVENKSDGIYWYGEDNKLLSAIDIITCKVYGWKNIVKGQYSEVINGYDAEYSPDHYQMTLKAPDGSVIKFSSSAIK